MITINVLRRNNPHLHTPIVPKKTKKQPETPLHAKIGTGRETLEARLSQGLVNLLQKLGQYETASDEYSPAFKKTSQFLAIVLQNADLNIYGVSV